MSLSALLAHECGSIKVYYDSCSGNPCKEFDNVGTLAIIGGLGNEEPTKAPPETTHVVLPVYKYEHGGVAYSTKPFPCPWDSGLVGYIHAPKNFEGMSDDQIRGNLIAELAIFSAWANGEVYGYINEETGDSCWGFYSVDDALEEAGV